jgi:hypothetical protein
MSNTRRPKFEGYMLVRDKNGKPKIDGDPRKLPQQIIQMMSDSEFAEAIEDYEMESLDAYS